MSSHPYLPADVLALIFPLIDKKDLKAVRLVCRLWSILAVTQLFDRTYFSGRPTDLIVFRQWSDNKACCEAVRELIIDASMLDDTMTLAKFFISASPIIRELYDENIIVHDLKSRRRKAEVEHIVQLLYDENFNPFEVNDEDYDSEVGRAYAKIDQGDSQELDLQGYKRLVDGWRRYQSESLEEQDSRDEDTLFRTLSKGLKRFINLKTATLQDDWTILTDNQEDVKAAEGEAYTIGAPFARSWPRSWPCPAGNTHNQASADRWHDHETMIRGLSLSGRRVKEISSDGNDCCGTPLLGFSLESIFKHMKRVYINLESLHLNIFVERDFVGTDDGRYDYLGAQEGLNICLLEIKDLKKLHLSFQDYRVEHEHPTVVKFEKVFGKSCSKWPHLTHFELFGVSAYKKHLLYFLRAHPLKTLCMGDFHLRGGDRWATTLADMRACLPEIEDFLVSEGLYDLDGTKCHRRYVKRRGCLPLELEKLVKFGGQNPLESENGRA